MEILFKTQMVSFIGSVDTIINSSNTLSIGDSNDIQSSVINFGVVIVYCGIREHFCEFCIMLWSQKQIQFILW